MFKVVLCTIFIEDVNKEKRMLHSFYFMKVKSETYKYIEFIVHWLNASKSICLFSFLCYSFVETIFKMKQKTLVTKYTDTLTFIFAHTTNPDEAYNATLNFNYTVKSLFDNKTFLKYMYFIITI